MNVKTPSRPNPAPAPSNSSQIGTIVIGAVAGLAVCAIGTAILVQTQAWAGPPPQVTS